MSTTHLEGTTTATEASGVTTVPMRFEVTTLPVADVDRAKAFYERLGWRLDIDFKPTEHTRGVQFTPPGSPASIQFGEGHTTTMTEPLQGLLLIVDDIEAARDELIGRGIEVSEIWHDVPGQGRLARVDPERRSYLSRAAFADPDGNTALPNQASNSSSTARWMISRAPSFASSDSDSRGFSPTPTASSSSICSSISADGGTVRLTA
jgi:catechol 2,3-dioxygenase-like lactoylglutathione lyase family enzyme